jgi:glycosyltransferase involved in cell wall biosynthesis
MPDLTREGEVRREIEPENSPGCGTSAQAAASAAKEASGSGTALSQMQRQLQQLRLLQGAAGQVSSGGFGWRGRVAAIVKHGIGRVLAWPLRPQRQFNMAVVRAMEQQARAIESLGRQVDALERRVSRMIEGPECASAELGSPTPHTVMATGQSSLPFGLNVVGLVTSEKGIGEAVRCNLRACQAGDIPHVAISFTDKSSDNVEQAPGSLSEQKPYRINLINVNPPELPRLVEQNPRYCEDRYNIGFWSWELASVPPSWRGCFGYLDEVWVPSRFVQEAVEQVAPIPVTLVPHAINPEIQCSPEWTRKRLGIAEDVFVFLFFFDFHSSIERKNPAGVIRAFREAFGERKDVLLLIKSSHALRHQGELWGLKKLVRGANVRIFNQVLPRTAIDSLMSLSDAYVSLHRSEGFGLTLSEAMACGKPVIATGYSGNMDFMTPDNSFPVRFRLVELEKDFGPYLRGNVWADPDLDHASELMARIVEDRKLASEVGERGRSDVRLNLHPSAIARIMLQRLKML